MRNIFWLLLLLVSTGAAAIGFNRRPSTRLVTSKLRQGRVYELASESFATMFKLAANELEDRGAVDMAQRLRFEWGSYYEPLMAGIQVEDAGDHPPLSEWVAQWYADIEQELGIQFMEYSHLRDIFILNYTTRVTFSPDQRSAWCLQQLAAHPEDTCEKEYARHFVGTKYLPTDPLNTTILHHGFSGVVTYWAIWGACEAATWGAGTSLICSPIGTVGEIGVERFVAPKASDAIWARNNQ